MFYTREQHKPANAKSKALLLIYIWRCKGAFSFLRWSYIVYVKMINNQLSNHSLGRDHGWCLVSDGSHDRQPSCGSAVLRDITIDRTYSYICNSIMGHIIYFPVNYSANHCLADSVICRFVSEVAEGSTDTANEQGPCFTAAALVKFLLSKCSCHCSGATKGALDMLTKVMALELGPHQVESFLHNTATSFYNSHHSLACYILQSAEWTLFSLIPELSLVATVDAV